MSFQRFMFVLTACTLLCSAGCESSQPRNKPAATTTPTTNPTTAEATSKPAAAEPRSLLGRPLVGHPPGGTRNLEKQLVEARFLLEKDPDNPERLVWVGRRLGYLWRFQDAIDIYTDGIRRFPEYAAFYRHRGQCYISLRRFDDAIRDLQHAVKLMLSRGDEAEYDGLSTKLNLPTTTLKFNVWYHLGIAYYCKGELPAALRAFQDALRYTRNFDDNTVAARNWMFLTLMRMHRVGDANAQLRQVSEKMNISENTIYLKCLMLHKGLIKPDDLLATTIDDVDQATIGYEVGMYYQFRKDAEKEKAMFERVVNGAAWPSFAFVAAEVELARQN